MTYHYRLGSLSVTLSNPRRKAGELHTLVSYTMRDLDWHGCAVLFSGDNLAVSPLHEWNSPDAALALLGFLVMQDGDVDPSYFAHYTPEQLRWRDERAADFAWQVDRRETARANRARRSA